MNADAPYRILVVDDNPTIHQDLRKILSPAGSGPDKVASLEAALFDETPQPEMLPSFTIDSAFQGEEGLELVRCAEAEGAPYALAFVDVRMPPGWDGVETLERCWQVAPDLEATICTAFTDYSWSEIASRLGHRDQLMILRKPFDVMEARQIAACATAKWTMARRLRGQIAELETLAAARAAAAARAMEVVALQSHFVTMASHEMRTPLATMQAAAEVMLRYDERLSAPQRAERIHRIVAEIGVLTTLLDELLASQRSESGSIVCRRQVVDAAALIGTVVARAGTAFGGSRIRADVPIEAPVVIDPDLVGRALGNVLSNALKFSADDAVVSLTARVQGGQLVLTVRDTGIGIEADDQRQLGTPFHRGRNVGTIPGRGLGMATVLRIVELHGGTFAIESHVGQGTSVTLTLPAMGSVGEEPSA